MIRLINYGVLSAVSAVTTRLGDKIIVILPGTSEKYRNAVLRFIVLMSWWKGEDYPQQKLCKK